MTNRIIKFRCWDSITGKMHYLSHMTVLSSDDANGIVFVNPDKIKEKIFSQEHIMQFTGLLDKTGKEIYEGDVVVNENRKKGARWVIEYQSDWICGFVAKGIGVKSTEIDIASFDLEIIGNIYETPSLLN